MPLLTATITFWLSRWDLEFFFVMLHLHYICSITGHDYILVNSFCCLFSSPLCKVATRKLHTSHSVVGGWHSTDSSPWLATVVATSAASSNVWLFFLTFVRQNLLPSSSVCLQLFGFHFYYKCSCKAVFISYTNLSHYATYVIDVSLSAIISIELCIGVAI